VCAECLLEVSRKHFPTRIVTPDSCASVSAPSLFVVLGLELRAFTLSHSTSPIFVKGFFQDRVLQTIFPGWFQTMILLISAS
jgi:hypothetical protein